ncbi:MAG: hypothetical protein ACTSRZ_04810 [Promethearchaeota archaeon]
MMFQFKISNAELYKEFINGEKEKILWVKEEIYLQFKHKKYLNAKDLEEIKKFEDYLEESVDLSDPEVLAYYFSQMREIDNLKRSKTRKSNNCSMATCGSC